MIKYLRLRGRINRIELLALTLILSLLEISAVLVFESKSTELILTSIIIVLVYLMQCAKRYHDLNKLGINGFVWFIVPIANIFYFFQLYFIKGNEGINKYGEPSSFTLFNRNKTKDLSIATDTDSTITVNKPKEPVNEPKDFYFRFEWLPEEYKGKEVFFTRWLKSDGDWVEEDQPIFVVTFNNPSSVLQTKVVLSEKSGFIQFHKKEADDLINPGDKIYTLFPPGLYEKENSPAKASFYVYLDKKKYTISEKHYKHSLEIKEWNKEDGEYVKKGDLVLTFGYSTSYGNKETINDYAEKDGYLDKEASYSMSENKLLYVIHNNDEDRIKRKFKRSPVITIDDFTGKKTIKWDPRWGIISYSNDNKVAFKLTFNCIDELDFIVFQFYSKDLMLSRDDIVSFLFDNKKIIDFKIINNSYKVPQLYDDKVFENKVLIADEELKHFEEQQFSKWKITLKKQNREIIGGIPSDYTYFKSLNNLALDIKNLAKEYRRIVRAEIPNYTPFIKSELPTSSNTTFTEECYLYLMADTTNNYHKIGISNQPLFRERTLQSEKPTIVLIASKKYPSRQIAVSIEKALHETFRNKNIRGEWFNLNQTDINEIVKTLE
jgi:uncharacterized membrane protein YhaH (DUF805 family)